MKWPSIAADPCVAACRGVHGGLMKDPASTVRSQVSAVVALGAALSACCAARQAAAAPQSFDDPALAGVGDAADAAELIPAAASGLPPVLSGQEPGARERPGAEPAAGTAPREWFGGAPWTEWSRATGDWSGARTRLADAGVDFNGSLIAEWSDVFSGGDAERSAFRFLLDLNATLDLGALAGLEGASVYIDFQTADTTMGGVFHGGFQAYSNIAIDGSITQLSQLWYEQWLLGDTLRVKAGKVDANTEFAYIGAAGSFINASAGFTPAIFALPTYPNPATSVNLFAYPTEGLYIGAGLYDGAAAVDGVPTGSRGPATFFSDDASDDWFVIGEAGLTADDVGGGLDRGRVALGAWWHSGEFARYDGGTDDGTSGIYALAEARVWRPDGIEAGSDESDLGVWAFLQYGWANEDVSAVSQQFGAGAVVRGMIGGREDDAVGIYASLVEFSGDPAAGFTDDEFSIELFYEHALTPSVTIKPDIQWFSHPGGGATDDALVGTLRCVIAF
jgi:porin